VNQNSLEQRGNIKINSVYQARGEVGEKRAEKHIVTGGARQIFEKKTIQKI